MATYSGVAARWGFALESPQGTRTVPTNFHPFVQESVTLGHEPVFSEAIHNNEPFMQAPAQGVVKPGGQIAFELTAETIGLALNSGLGTNVDSGAGPYDHTMTRVQGELSQYTHQLVKPTKTGLVAYDLVGALTAGWGMTIEPGRRIAMTLDLLGANLTDTETPASPTYPTLTPLVFRHASLTLNSVSIPFDSLTLDCVNGVVAENKAGASGLQEPWETGEGQDYTGSITTDYENSGVFDDWVAGTSREMVLTISAGASAALVITHDIAYTDDPTPLVSGKGKVKQQVGFRFVSGGGSANDFVLTNGEATL